MPETVVGHFKRRQQLDKNDQNIEYYLRLDSCFVSIGQPYKFGHKEPNTKVIRLLRTFNRNTFDFDLERC